MDNDNPDSHDNRWVHEPEPEPVHEAPVPKTSKKELSRKATKLAAESAKFKKPEETTNAFSQEREARVRIRQKSKRSFRWKEIEDQKEAIYHLLDTTEPMSAQDALHHEAIRYHLKEYFDRKKEIETCLESGIPVPDFDLKPHPLYGENPLVAKEWGINEWSNIRKIQNYFLHGIKYSHRVS